MKFKVIFFTLIIFSNTIFAQLYSLSVNFNGKPTTNLVRSFQSSTTYVAIDDLLDILQIQYKIKSETLQQEISLNEGILYITAFNPFLFLKRKDGKNISYQMLQPTDYKYGKIFVPIKSFAEFVNKWTTIKINYKEEAFLININYDKTSQPILTQNQTETSIKTEVKDRNIEVKPEPITQSQNLQASNTKFDLFDFTIEEKSNGYIFRIKSRKAIQSVSKNLSGSFLYIRIPNSTIDIERFNTLINNGIIESISSVQSGANADIKLTLKDKIQSHEIVREKRTNDILLLLHVPSEIIKKLKEEKKKQTQKPKGDILDVIVIDPGHGGRDPGAIGYRGTKEKDVNLGISLKLGKLIEKNHKNIKVVYTRADDRFIELYRRGQIANENNGKLFISIHCNSTDERPGTRKGSEVYLLRPGRTEDAIRIAERENSVIKLEEGYEERYKFLSDENFILTAMASTANVKHSEKFAELISEKFEKNLPLKNNGVKQAGFYVLVGAAMPSVLIETGYINNPDDEMFLRSEDGQQKIAEEIYKAIVEYKNYYEQLASK